MAATGLTPIGPPVFTEDGSVLSLPAVREGRAGIWSWPLAGGEPHLLVAFDDPTLVTMTYPGTLSLSHDRLFPTVSERESDIW